MHKPAPANQAPLDDLRKSSKIETFLGDHQPHTATTKDFGSKKGFRRGWCTNCQNLREQQNAYHPQDCTGDVHHGFCGGGARIAGFEFFPVHPSLSSRLMQKCAKLVLKHFRDLRVAYPQHCAKVARTQLLRNSCTNIGSRAQFFHNFARTKSKVHSFPGVIAFQ